MKVDLHLHSNHSDGNWSPSDMVAHAIKIGMSVIALTDHDTVSGIDEALSAASDRLEVIPAVEINTVWCDDAGVWQDVHILGYFIDRKNQDLQDVFETQNKARVRQVEKLVQILADDGLDISIEQIRRIADGSPLGKVHVTQAIVACGGAKNVNEAYRKYYDRKSKYFVRRESVSPFEAIDAIHAAGGITSIAHPSYSADLTDLIVELARHGLDGIEVYHSSNRPEHEEKHLTLAGRLNLIVTGGSDCHGPWGEHSSLMGTVPVPEAAVAELKRALVV